jgi:xylulokinase
VRYLLGIDIGTHESKGVLADQDGRIVATKSVAHETDRPRPGWAEHDAEAVWWQDVVVLARELPVLADVAPRDIAAVGCSGIGPCVVPVDRDGRALRPGILYGIDTRASEEVRDLSTELGEEWILRETGSALSAQAAGPKILWIRRHEPDVWARTHRVLTSTSYVVLRLTGRAIIDHYTAAAYGPLYNLHDRTWDDRALSLVCPRAVLPEIDWSTAIAGSVTREAAAITRLREGTPVVVGSADAASEATAAGALDPGDTMLMYGSSMFLIQVLARLPASRVQWPTVYLEPGMFALAAGMSTAGALAAWLRDEFAQDVVHAADRGGRDAYEVLVEEARRVAPGADGLIALPYFSGERTPINDPRARGALLGLTLSHGRPHVFRALLEGIAYGVRANLEAMDAAGAPAGRLVAIGGGVRNDLWVQTVSDVSGRPQEVQETPGASYGDTMLASVGIGLARDLRETRRWVMPGRVVEPRAEARAFYDRTYPLYRQLYEQTAEIAHALADG